MAYILECRGGGNVENTSLNRSSPPLQWMVQEAGIFGLRTKRLEPKLVAENQIQVKDSLTLFWWPLEIMAFRRLTYTDEKRTTYKYVFSNAHTIDYL